MDANEQIEEFSRESREATSKDYTDEQRWRFVRDNLFQIMAAKMNGEHFWRIRSPHTKGSSPEEVIDKMMAIYEIASPGEGGKG